MMHSSTFEYLKPTDAQINAMASVRGIFAQTAYAVGLRLPAGADKDHVMRLLRTAAMWANVAITREADGSPREDLL